MRRLAPRIDVILGLAAVFLAASFVLFGTPVGLGRSEEHTFELQSPVPISYAVFCLKKKTVHITFHIL